MNIEIIDTSHGPVYLQIREQITKHIADKTLDGGAKLPSLDELARKLGIDRGEVQRAYFELEQNGTIEKRTSKDFLGGTKTTYFAK
ncbi:MAG: hypothetical protein NVSMB56_20780 [Pyrinomonadaceae bacterium]